MLDELIEVEESELPDLDDEIMDKLAKEFGRKYEYYDDSRKILTTEIWPACDKAWMAIKDDLTWIPSMKLIDNGMLGESNVRTALISNRNQILSGLIPGDESWLEPVSMTDDDDEATLRKTKNWLIDLAEKGSVPQSACTFVDQLLIRGTSAMGVRWNRTRRVRRINKNLVKHGKILAEAMDAQDEEGNPLQITGKGKYYQTVFNGPRVYTIDMHRLLLDPEPDNDDDVATIYIMFKSLQELKSTKLKNGEPAYDPTTCENLREYTYQEYYNERKSSCESAKLMGIDPSLETLDKFVPVYMFHKLIETTEDGDVFVDKFFYCARTSKDQGGWKIIRVMDNPSDFGHKPFYYAQCDQWLNLPYGTGQAEKSIAALKALNIISALSLNGMALNVVPPYSYATGVLKDDRKPKWQPGSGQEIIMRPGVGMDWIQPFPINPNNVMVGMQEQRFIAEKINAQTGASSAGVLNNPAKTMSTDKTATEVRQESQEGAISNDTLVSKLATEVLEPVMQCVHDYGRQYQGESEGATYITKNSDGKPVSEKITAAELNRNRTIKIMGRRGLASKAHEIQNLFEVLKILANPQAAQVLASAPVILQDVLLKLVARLGLPMKEEYRMPPEMLAAKTPQAQMAAIQGAIKNPEMRQKLMQMIMQDPEAQQMMQQQMQQVQAQTASEIKQHQAEVAKEAAKQNKLEKHTHETVAQHMADHALGDA